VTHRWACIAAAIYAGCHEGAAVPTDAGSTGSDPCVVAQLDTDACARFRATVLPAALPPAKGNRFGDNPDAAKLGFDLFFDPGAFSPAGENIACARCHSPEHGFADVRPLSVGLVPTLRNAPAVVNAARNFPHFWDGRADSLWSQPLQTIENEGEMNGTRLGVTHFIAEHYRDEYEKAFGPLPDLSRFPAAGKPGSAAWDAMTSADRATVTLVYVNVGKALEAYMRKVATGPSAVDRFFAGTGELSSEAVRGMRVFASAGCFGCHGGPYFTDGRYHDLDVPVPPFLAATKGDPGRAHGVTALTSSEFNGASVYYDRSNGEPARIEEETSTDFDPDGAFLTPSLRNVGETSPYGHNGAFATLEDVVRFHLAGGGPHAKELTRNELSDDDVAALIAFLQALHGDPAPLPWSFWPSTPKPSTYPDAGADAIE